MNTKDKHNPVKVCIVAAQMFFGIATFLILAFLLIGEFIYPDERDVVKSECRVFETKWEQVLENGEKIPVEVPGKVPAEYGEVVTLTTILPENIMHGENICFRIIWQDVTIYIDGQLRESYSTIDSRPFGTNSAMRYIFLELTEEDKGKELIYQFSSNSKYAGDVRTSYIGDRASIWTYFMGQSGLRTAIAIFLMFLSMFCIVVCAILRFIYKRKLGLVYLAWTIFFCALWMLSESVFRQILFRNISILSNGTYWCLMLIPFPLVLYINDIQKGRYEKLYVVSIIYSVIMLVVGTILQIFDVVQFVEQVPLIHTGIAYAMICLIGTITVDMIKKRAFDYIFVGVGVYGLLLTAVIEILLYYDNSSVSLGTVLGIGLLFLLIMAIIKTGQDLFESEKKQQQAIMAKEAQAKFLANMSHEIRTPINAVIGMNEMILRENNSETVQEYANNIQRASNMLLQLVNDILDFSKIESGQLELVNEEYRLVPLIQDEILLLNARAAGKPIEIEIDVDTKLPSALYGDQLRIKQIFTNILSNAVKYTKEGKVTLKVFSERRSDDTFMLCFSVKDTGIGIKREDLAKLFAGFKRLELKKNHNIEGTGLGLNITKQLVDLMKGNITVESEYGKGSKFTVSIPQKIMDEMPVGDFKAAKDEENRKNISPQTFKAPEATLLVVDDNSMNLSVIKSLLKRTEIQVDVAVSGKECIELTKKKTYDTILMDHMMPEMDGVEALHLIKEDQTNPNRDTIVIALTANAIAGCKETYLEYGFDDYFAKPVKADKLEELLLQYLPKHLVTKMEETNDRNVTKQHKEIFAMKEQKDDLLTIDYEIGLSYCMNSQELYDEIRSAFCRQSKAYVPKLREYAENNDWSEYGIVAHALKGNSLNIGAVKFSELSLTHELAGKERNADFIKENYSEYIEKLNQLIAKAEEW